jgi:hypothetical protein
MKRAITCASLCGLLFACGARKPMDGKGSVIYWTVTDTAVNFVGCSDDPQFQANFTPIAVGSNFEYRLASDGQSATSTSCTTTNSNSCTDNTSMVFQVAGDELLLSQTLNSPVTGSTCSIEDSRNWDLVDSGQSLGITISDALSLVGDATSCAQVQQQQINRSPDKKGIQGCIINYALKASFGAG